MEGTIMHLDRDEILVDIGSKSEASFRPGNSLRSTKKAQRTVGWRECPRSSSA